MARDGVERVIVCPNLERALEDAATRQSILANLEQQLEAGSWRDSLKPAARRYPTVDGSNARLDAKYDGKWILRTIKTPSSSGRSTTPVRQA